MRRLLGEAARRCMRSILPYSLYVRIARAYGSRVSSHRFGADRYRELMKLSKDARGGDPVAFEAAGMPSRMWVRPGTTDPLVFEHSLIRRAYACFEPRRNVDFILDGGANAGYTCAYFLSRFHEARATAVEPEKSNFELASRNLAVFGERVRLVNGGLWPERAGLKIIPGDGEHGFEVRPAVPGEAVDCEAYDPLSLMREAGAERISLFKCDIEGAETRLFSTNPDPWISVTDAIVIEVHGPAAHRAVYDACRRHGFHSSQYRELHVFQRA